MTDITKQLRDIVGVQVGDVPALIHQAADHIDALAADLADAIRAKDLFQRMTRAHWEALCAMRNSINDHIPMPNTDSGPLFSPEDGPIYADIAERVVDAILALAAERDKLAGQLAAAVDALQYISNGDDPYEPCGWAIHTARDTLSRITGETP
jgi:hypothetical protein